MGMREKLLKLLIAAQDLITLSRKADFLVANGVTIPVRCEECKYSYDGVANLMCGRCGQNINGIRLGGVSVKAEHFCSYGERKDNEHSM